MRSAVCVPLAFAFLPHSHWHGCSSTARAKPGNDGDWSLRSCVETVKIRCRARVAYDGSNFAGFQIQHRRSSSSSSSASRGKENSRTVQGELEKALARKFREFGVEQSIKVVGAGRTDTGVHARGQAIHFDVLVNSTRLIGDSVAEATDKESRVSASKVELAKGMPRLQKTIARSMLPPDVVLWNLQVAPEPLVKLINGRLQDKEWNAMYDSTHKWYSYRIHVGPVMSPLERYTRWHPDQVQMWFEETRFRRLLKAFEGRHDFRTFASGMEQNEKGRREYLDKKQHLNNQQSAEPTTSESESADAADPPSEYLVDTVRTVRSVELTREFDDWIGDGFSYRIDFVLDGALYRQVRNMVGTVVEVCRPKGRLSEQEFYSLIDSSPPRSRALNPAKPAPPQGLVLEHVYFEDEGAIQF